MGSRSAPTCSGAALVLVVAISVSCSFGTGTSFRAEQIGGGPLTPFLGGPFGAQVSQTVTGTSYWVSLCESSATVNCIIPSGVVYVPPAGVIVATEVLSDPPVPPTTNGFEEINATTRAIGPVQNLSCEPGVPYYPGFGADVYVPCELSSEVIVINSLADHVVATIPTPFPGVAFTYDPRDGFIYMGDGGGSSGAEGGRIVAINTTSWTSTPALTVANATFLGEFESGTGLAFDAPSDQLLMFSRTDQLLSVSPAGASPVPVASLPPGANGLAVDPGAGLIFAAVADPSSVLVFNATTYAEVANFSMPPCIEGFCGSGNQVTEFAFDARHGDAYLASGTALFVANLSRLSIVGTILTVGDGASKSATYVPSTDEVWGTYFSPDSLGPGYLVELDHQNVTVLREFLWQPESVAVLVLGAVVGVAVGVVLFVRRGKRQANLPPSQ
jgi:hypothetical protein